MECLQRVTTQRYEENLIYHGIFLWRIQETKHFFIAKLIHIHMKLFYDNHQIIHCLIGK